MGQGKRFEVMGSSAHVISIIADGFRLADGDLAFHVGKDSKVELVVAFARGEWDWVRLANEEVA